MTVSMNIHGTTSIHAEAHHATDCEDPCNWLVLSFIQKPRHVDKVPVFVPDHTVTIFLSDPTLADRLATAINAVAKAQPPSPTTLSPSDYRE